MNQRHPYREDMIRVEVGEWVPDGTFLGSIIEFYGQEAGHWTEPVGTTGAHFEQALYRVVRPGGGEGYRVYERYRSRWEADSDHAMLHPAGRSHEERGGAMVRTDPTRTRHEPYTEAEAREGFPRLFAAIGSPNVVRLDEEGTNEGGRE